MDHQESTVREVPIRGTFTEKSLSNYGKKVVAHSMCRRGHSFLVAAILLEERKGDRWVVLCNLCQGVELVPKGILLLCDYDQFRPKLKKPLGHNLRELEREVRKTLGLKRESLSPALAADLEKLDRLYRLNILKYASGAGIILGDGKHINSDRVLTRIAKISMAATTTRPKPAEK